MPSVNEIVAKGRPDSGWAVTHTYSERTMADCPGQLPYGVVIHGQDGLANLVRDYTWRRFTGRVRLQTGEVKARYKNAPGRAMPAMLAVCLETLGGQAMGQDVASKVDALASMTYSDVLVLVLDRLIERNQGLVPVSPDLPCMACGEALGLVKITRKDVQLAWLDWTSDNPPAAVCWLDAPMSHGRMAVDALVLQPVTWRGMYGGAKLEDLQNPEWATVRAASSSVVGFVCKDQVHMAALPADVVESQCLDSDFDRLAQAVYACSGGAQMGSLVRHGGCGEQTLVPFDLTAPL